MANLLIAKTNAYLSQEEYQKWHDLYIGMIADGFLMVDDSSFSSIFHFAGSLCIMVSILPLQPSRFDIGP